ncbi:hypothetical protein EGT74_24385 [Chitinophaga lutea]|uniref:Uncharacterized protein n=1 Tax=Chitinophaga lutea TaxID=2488634 RepID=A0A3N4PBP9_9BACT|nr:hypothetical protein [Chitinophaga lutea]RPE05525.1 hypothetical protein EGT74_24385 [Chitinophaga lutea]
MKIETVKAFCSYITMSVFGAAFQLRIERDCKDTINGRIFLQVTYEAPCTKTGDIQTWHGRKWYLSEHMTYDEIVKTAYAAFEAAVKHEVMEGFKFDGKVVFNPHVNYEALLSITDNEVSRAAAELSGVLM